MANYALRSFSGSAIPVDLSGPISASATSIPLTFPVSPISSGWVEAEGANAGSVLGTSGNFLLVVDGGLSTEEHIVCSGFSGNNATVVTRGADQTTAVAHVAPATASGLVYPILGGIDGYEANYAVSQTVGQIAAKGDLLTGSAANTLAKTGVGTNGQALFAASAAAGGVVWANTYRLNPTAKSGAYTAVNYDLVEMAGNHAVTLPAPSTAYQVIGVISVNGTGAAPAEVSTPSGVILGPGIVAAGVANILLGAPGAYVVLESDGTNWVIVAGQQDTGWVTQSLLNSYTVVGGDTAQARLVGNRVMCRGTITSGSSGTIAFTITFTASTPQGAPATQINGLPTNVITAGVRAAGNTSVDTSGDVIPAYAGSPSSVFLAGVQYLVDG